MKPWGWQGKADRKEAAWTGFWLVSSTSTTKAPSRLESCFGLPEGISEATSTSVESIWNFIGHLLRHSSTAAVMSREIHPGENSLTIRVSRITWWCMIMTWALKIKLILLLKSHRWGGCEASLGHVEDEDGDNQVWGRWPRQLLLLQPKSKIRSYCAA